MSTPQHVLITGGAGFIGSHLCEAFLARGYAVTALDNLVTGRRSNIEGALAKYGPSKFQFIECDVSEPLPEARLEQRPASGWSKK